VDELASSGKQFTLIEQKDCFFLTQTVQWWCVSVAVKEAERRIETRFFALEEGRRET
jgi:hypothetical protein